MIQYYQIAFWILLAVAVWHYFKYNDEFLLLPVAFFYFTGISVTWLLPGKAEWVRWLQEHFFSMTDEKAIYDVPFAMGTLSLCSVTASSTGKCNGPAGRWITTKFSRHLLQRKGLIGLFIFTILFTITPLIRLYFGQVIFYYYQWL